MRICPSNSTRERHFLERSTEKHTKNEIINGDARSSISFFTYSECNVILSPLLVSFLRFSFPEVEKGEKKKRKRLETKYSRNNWLLQWWIYRARGVATPKNFSHLLAPILMH